MKPEDIQIVIIRGAGYSGASWFNLVLGSHPEAMSLGPISRILSLDKNDREHACLVHKGSCSLWLSFLSKNNSNRFFEELAVHTGKQTFLVNYPSSEIEQREIAGKGFKVQHIKLVRDGRANLWSKIRHERALRETSALECILKWQIPKWEQVSRKIPNDPHLSMLVRYEDMLEKPMETLHEIGAFVGLDYTENAFRFWEFDHHPTAGNTGVIDTICKMQGREGWKHHRENTYSDYVSHLKENPEVKFNDEEWKRSLTRGDLLAFDCLLGKKNALYGYERDQFSDDEVKFFWAKIRTLDIDL